MTPRGWCPSLLTPMPADDGLLVRVKPTAAQLSATQLAGIAEAAAREGNGQVQLTSRANLQVRGLTAASAERFARVVLDLGLSASSAPAEQVRNVLSAPLAGADPTAHDVRPFAVALETLLVAGPGCHALPAKFGFSVDGGGLAVLPRSADILVELCAEGAAIALADATLAHRCAATPAAVCEAASALIAVFLAEGAKRMRHLVSRLGAERIFAAAGLTAAPFVPAEPRPLPLGFTAYNDRFESRPVIPDALQHGVLPRRSGTLCRSAPTPDQHRTATRCGASGVTRGDEEGFAGVADETNSSAARRTNFGCFVAALPHGRGDARQLALLADAAERHGNGRLATTPWRAFALPAVGEPAPLAVLCAAAGFILDPADPRAATIERAAELTA